MNDFYFIHPVLLAMLLIVMPAPRAQGGLATAWIVPTKTLAAESVPVSGTPETVGRPMLNQWFIEARRAELASLRDRVLPAWSPPEAGPSFDDPRSVLRYILASFDEAVVYPTEQYFYYAFSLGERRVSGNIRFTDAATGVIHVGYFNALDQAEMNYASLDAGEGVRVEVCEADPSAPHERIGYQISLDGETCQFVLASEYRAVDRDLALWEQEEVVAGILDESAYALTLIFDGKNNGFRYILSAALGPPERLVPVADVLMEATMNSGAERSSPLVVGVESGFVFLESYEPKRLTLVGVKAENIRRNNYFDGPFDQVPPDLELDQYLHRAYPYTQEAFPVDKHGNFVGRPGHRVAISPYIAYENLAQMHAVYRELVSRGLSTEQIAVLLTREAQQSISGPARGALGSIDKAAEFPHPGRPVTLDEIIRRGVAEQQNEPRDGADEETGEHPPRPLRD